METYGLEKLGILNPTAVWRNLSPAALVEAALRRGEGQLSDKGALVVTTGKYTGRSPEDKFVVDTPGIHDDIKWGKINVPIEKAKFDAIKEKLCAYLQNREVFIFDGFAGADPAYTKKFRIINELASENLFIHQLLIRPTADQLASYGEADFTIIAAPGFKCIPEVDGVHSEAAIMIDYEAKLVVIAGSQYAGEIKKSVFSVMNYLMPKESNVLPMHCSANMDPQTGETAVFFGLSGTGKTTLSADPNRKLIGDDEHGWSEHGIFNFEGGCYAKTINLDPEGEPEIYNAIKFGSLVENVIIDPVTRVPDFFDGSLTENTRVGYPVDFISNAAIPGIGDIPKVMIFLTADAFGVLPPISRLDENAAMYHFVTGFTSKLAGTERGVTEPQPTFSTCFGAPFMPLDLSLIHIFIERWIRYHRFHIPVRVIQHNHRATVALGDVCCHQRIGFLLLFGIDGERHIRAVRLDVFIQRLLAVSPVVFDIHCLAVRTTQNVLRLSLQPRLTDCRIFRDARLFIDLVLVRRAQITDDMRCIVL